MKRYFLKPGYLWMYGCIVVLLLTGAVLRYSTQSRLGFEIGVGLVVTFVIVWSLKTPILKLEAEHFAMKVAPGAPLQLVRYRDIRSVEMQGKKKLLVSVEAKGARKVVKIPLAMLRAAEAAEVTKFLRGKVAA